MNISVHRPHDSFTLLSTEKCPKCVSYETQKRTVKQVFILLFINVKSVLQWAVVCCNVCVHRLDTSHTLTHTCCTVNIASGLTVVYKTICKLNHVILVSTESLWSNLRTSIEKYRIASLNESGTRKVWHNILRHRNWLRLFGSLFLINMLGKSKKSLIFKRKEDQIFHLPYHRRP